ATVAVEVAEEAAGEAVARTGWVADVLERDAREAEEALLGEERRAVLALLGHDDARAHRHQLPGGARQVGLAGEHPDLRVVQDHAVDLADRRDERVARRV